ncbi:hypothetical protein GBA52_003762 [Prunus armeniaca]|nr:hypothetical protein GBA52_003762 [Prunus armeniaca]
MDVEEHDFGEKSENLGMNKQFNDLVKQALGVNGSLVGDILHEDVMSKFWFQGLVSNLFAHFPNFLEM